ncbi:ComEC/Rec2 family competence protein [Serratia fonticola]|uniref:ComEC/Rec2 family competence protein n=1 Tax=Serratia fonticola TaxID=47917 RepID=UPI00217CA025|nr:MBL fold metallo-hydrolase [Serratia fonticola]CAI0802724.1 ComEC family competence protein [Serratia fonticola]
MKVTVFNVEQGDSFLIQHNDKSNYPTLLIDAGSACKKVYKKIPAVTPNLNVLITHSHSDHMNGLPDIIKKLPVSHLFLPCYLPEILQIVKILNIKFSNFSNTSLDKIKKIPVTLLSSGDYLYPGNNNDFKILNPQRDLNSLPEKLNSTDNSELDKVINKLNELGLEVNINDILDYFPEFFPLRGRNQYIIESREFIKRVFETMSPFVFKATVKNIRKKIRTHLNLISNHTSIVFRCNIQSKNNDCISWLFTGDADKDSFEKIIANDVVSLQNVNVLKVPHHGSNENMDAYILSIINPFYAVVSHNNRSGNAKDPHPNQDIINILDNQCVNVFYTNDVKKDDIVIKTCSHTGIFKTLFDFC